VRKVVASLFISLDGVAESPDKWQFEFDDDMMAAITAEIAAVDTILLGRVTLYLRDVVGLEEKSTP